MKKKLFICLAIFLIIIIAGITYCLSQKTSAQANKSTTLPNKQNVKLVIDTDNKSTLPKKFRTSKQKISSDKLGHTDLSGLSDLNISGSGALSEKDLALIKQTIGNMPILDVDLRQECHGFVNGMGISWYGKKDDANLGLTRNQVINDEKNKLNKIIQEKYVKFKKLPKGKSITTISEIKDPKTVMTEEQLTKSLGISYLRITVPDHLKPSNDQVDLFVNSVEHLSQNTWLHFHCRGGAGRTTTFMTMYDMMRNAKKVKFDDIMARQFLIGGSNLLNGDDEDKANESESRAQFLKDFYKYCYDNNDGFKTSWSEWCKGHRIS